MKRMCKGAACLLALCLMLLFTLSCAKEPTATLHRPGEEGYIPTSADVLDFAISSEQAFVYDVEGKQYLYLKGASQVLYPASTTKLLTILYALTLLSPEAKISPRDELEQVAEGSSVAYIKTYHTLTVEMLIEGMLLPSGNDAAYALAAAGGRALLGDDGADGKTAVSAFMDGMNRYAGQLGLCGSRFLTPDGNEEEGQHYSTVEDMTLVARLAAENELIMRYAGMASDDVVYASGEVNHWENTNLLLHPDSEFYSSDVTGLKTGSLGKGKYSVIVTAEIGGKQYIIGVFAAKNSKDRFHDALLIVNGLRQYSGYPA